MKYLKISVSGPYINTEHVTYVRLDDDDLLDNGDISQSLKDDLVNGAVWEYVESWEEVVDETQVPEGDK